MQFLLSSLFASSLSASLANAAVATEYNYVTKVVYQEVNVLVDSNGTPYSTETVDDSSPLAQDSTSTVLSSTSVSSTTAATTSYEQTIATPASSHSHAQNYNYISDTYSSSSSLVTTTSEEWIPSTSSTTTPASTSALAATSTSTSTSAAPAETSSASGSSGSSFSGQATYYDVGLGACGYTNSDSELVAALNWEQWDQFGSMSNGNPACGKKATLTYQGKSVTVSIVDKCMGCKYGDLDLSPTAFEQLADESVGRFDMTWSFN